MSPCPLPSKAQKGSGTKCLSYATCTGSSEFKHSEPFETLCLQRTMIKLGSLLVLGFGEAGANIVSQNMSGSHTAGVNAMIAGTRVDCIIGYTRIQDFSIFTEVLQGQVMTFVNQVPAGTTSYGLGSSKGTIVRKCATSAYQATLFAPNVGLAHACRCTDAGASGRIACQCVVSLSDIVWRTFRKCACRAFSFVRACGCRSLMHVPGGGDRPWTS